MKITSAEFLKSSFNAGQFPNLPHPEFAFVGRSNVGKSSLLNMITGVRNICKVGARPGVTQSINFFIANGNTTLVDLPGYGYAQVPLEIKKRFLPMIKDYLKQRDRLKLVFLLVDIRRVPDDFERNIIMECEARNIPVAIIATKCDKLSKNGLTKSSRDIATALEIDPDSIFFTSSKTGKGKREILSLMGRYL